MKKILLTGGNGFFCTRLAAKQCKDYEIVALGRQALDITNAQQAKAVFLREKPDIVIHAAANAVTDFCNRNPEIAEKINVEGAVNVAQAAKAVGAKFLFISTEQVFNGNQESGPYTEDSMAVPDTVYGQNKLKAEGLLRALIEELWIVRFTWLFGMPMRQGGMAGNILWDTIKDLMAGRKIYASPHEFRGMTDVDEMVVNVGKIFDLPYGTYHLGSTNDLSRYDIVAGIFTALGLADRIDELLIKDEKKYAGHPRDVRLATKKAARYGLDFTPTMNALEKCIQEYGLRIK